ncbi:SAM-dependent methyltransferase [Sphingomonas oryzagri]|uniref:Cyclopropane-fatty-acyl-phospholipid synthase family protein n=1 Tax=Sphingomonas oryzagri TaxID=3042314 RepID=A0ABT6N4I7_9SPHN|nr:cyclopropane-fatty-acyl-phospholipid synthase family protein [Sphingomonas oryzagri]MDH7640052.1 cyclopropane-fatty-acyl-phospholipid synthase family protein [Sphingomonas oryzagri]
MLLDPLLRRIVKQGELIITDAEGKVHHYGAPDPERRPVRLTFHDKRVPLDVMRRPTLGFPEAYMDGRLDVEGDDILAFVDLFRFNARWESAVDDGLGVGEHPWLTKLGRFNSLVQSKRNVAHHYDLSDRLYDLFLDRDKQYSCAYFTPENEDRDLDRAQLAKKAHIAAKLNLKPGQRVLDIGCGWGGMALYLNRVADVDVLGITLSEEQLKVAKRRAAEAGVADRVKFELIDYRTLTGRFDRIVSVGMFEHVGAPSFREYFAKVRDLLADDGVALIHTIGRMGPPSYTDSFTAKYIFPGGYIPALSETVAASEREHLMLSDVEVLRLHYGYTIQHWYDRAGAAKEQIVALYDERFYRMWRFYLAGALTAFTQADMVNFQLQYVKDRHALPLTRDYIAETEKALLAKG